MSVYFAIPLLILIGVLQTSVVPALPVIQIKPDLMLIAIACWGVLHGPRQALFWSFVGGVWLDLLSYTPIGTSVIAFSAVAAMATVGESAWIDRNLFLVLIISFLGTLAYCFIFLAVLELAGRHSEFQLVFLNVAIPSAVLNTILSPIIYFFLGRLYKRTRAVQELEW